jgi:hypothetical protein
MLTDILSMPGDPEHRHLESFGIFAISALMIDRSWPPLLALLHQEAAAR